MFQFGPSQITVVPLPLTQWVRIIGRATRSGTCRCWPRTARARGSTLHRNTSASDLKPTSDAEKQYLDIIQAPQLLWFHWPVLGQLLHRDCQAGDFLSQVHNCGLRSVEESIEVANRAMECKPAGLKHTRSRVTLSHESPVLHSYRNWSCSDRLRLMTTMRRLTRWTTSTKLPQVQYDGLHQIPVTNRTGIETVQPAIDRQLRTTFTVYNSTHGCVPCSSFASLTQKRQAGKSTESWYSLGPTALHFHCANLPPV